VEEFPKQLLGGGVDAKKQARKKEMWWDRLVGFAKNLEIAIHPSVEFISFEQQTTRNNKLFLHLCPIHFSPTI